MNIHERLEAFFCGERPDEIPYTIYTTKWRDVKDDPDWLPMFAQGLILTEKLYPFTLHVRNMEVIEKTSDENGVQVRQIVQRTPMGDISAKWINNWHQKYWLETPADYRVMTYIIEQTEITPAYEAFRAREREIAPLGIVWTMTGRTPLQEMLVDYAGLEHFSMHLFDYETEVRQLYVALLNLFRRKVEIVANGPGRFVSNLENFTSESLGPRRYREFLLPVYEECFPQLQAAGKIIGSHYDGRTASCKDLIARAPIDVIESLTPPPEGDQTLAEARAAWPEKLFWSNINLDVYELPKPELRRVLLERIAQAAPDGRRLAFEVSEDRPANWKESFPIVLEVLKETRV